MDIKEIVAEGNDPVWVIGRLKEKSIRVPAWATLDKAYDPKKHPVMDKKLYPDKEGRTESDENHSIAAEACR